MVTVCFTRHQKDKKQKRTKELMIHFVFTCSVTSKIEFSWENSTYLLGKLISLNGFGGLKYSILQPS